MLAVTDRVASWRRRIGSPAAMHAVLAAAAVLGVGLPFALATAPLGHPSPFDPVAGIALVVALYHRRSGLVGIGIGVLALHLALHLAAVPTHEQLLAVPGPVAAALLQAWFGAALIRRYLAAPIVLSEPREIALFFLLGGAIAAAAGATLAMLTAGTPPADTGWLTAWAGHWTAQVLGVLLLAPVAMTLLAEPRREWAARRTVIVAGLLTLALVYVIAARQIHRLDEQRARLQFERQALNAAALLDLQLQRPLLALDAMHSVFIASDSVNRTQWRRATQAWVQPPTHIQALGWSEHVEADAIQALEERAREEGFADYRVRHRDGSTAAAGSGVVAIRYIEPLQPNAAALGVNALSIAQPRDAIERAIRSDGPAATGGFRLSQDSAEAPQSGIVVYRAIHDGAPVGEAARRRSFRGVVFVTLRMDDLLAAAMAALPAALTVCIVDEVRAGLPNRLAGPPGCESAVHRFEWSRPTPFADRDWTVRVGAAQERPFLQEATPNWVFSGRGILLAAMVGAMLLAMSGRARRIEAAVAERTAALREEVREREQAEASMRESEQRFRNIFNNVPIGVVYTDLQGRLQQVNPQFCQLSGFTAEQLLRTDLFDVLHPDDVAVERRSIRELLDGEIAMHRGHCRIVRSDGEIVWVQASLTLLRDSEGRPRRLVGVTQDITEHLRLIEAERARDLAESANRAKNEFLSRMSHELRTPLNAMLGFAQLLELDERHPLAPAQRPWVTQIQHAGWHLLDMINDVLDLSRIESGNIRLQLENLDLEALVDAAVALIEGDAAKRGIRIRRRLAAAPVAVVSDITRVKQILLNLLSNAVKYNTDHGSIAIEIDRDESHATLVVRDSGMGMTAEQLASLFQPFNRLGRERSAIEGTGIGLVIARRLAEWMGGELRAESTPGSGSSFILRLPLASTVDTVRQDLPHDEAASQGYHRRIVHYIEDNETNVEVMRGILAQRPQVEMAVSMTGLDAVAELRRQPPDVILLDMNLPDIDGLELLRHIKSDPATASVPVVIVSADALGEQIDGALAAGALRYLTKPVNVAEVLRAIDEVLDVAVSRFL